MAQNLNTIKQIHIRKNGFIIELDFVGKSEYLYSSFLQCNNKSQNFFDFMYFINEFHEKAKKSKTTQNLDKLYNSLFFNQKIFNLFDKLFNENKENLFFMRGNYLSNENGLQTKYIGFNYTFLSWISKQTSFLDDNLINNCLKFSCFNNFDEFCYYIREILSNPEKTTTINLFIDTLCGMIGILANLYTQYWNDEKMLFHYIVFEKKNFDEFFLKTLELFRNGGDFPRQEDSKTLNHRYNFNANHRELLKLYYCKAKN